MSHVVSLKTKINSLEALERAAKSCGLEMHKGQSTYRWWGHSVGDYPMPEGFTKDQLGKCNHALSVPGNSQAYEIGVVDMNDGTFRLLYDFYAGGKGLVERIGGNNADKLMDEYAIARAQLKCEEMCWMTERQGDSLVVYHPSGGSMVVTKDKVDALGFVGNACVTATEAISAALGITESQQLKPEHAILTHKNTIVGN